MSLGRREREMDGEPAQGGPPQQGQQQETGERSDRLAGGGQGPARQEEVCRKSADGSAVHAVDIHRAF